jgi:hypothetical protein
MKRNFLYFILLLVTAVACGKKEEMTNEEKLAGKDQKTWEATRETDASGDKDKLTRDEKKESITFSRSGDVKMGNGNEMMSGKWSLEGNNLSLQFTGSNVSENFTVLALEDDEIKLRAGDGSQLTMKPD